MRRVGGAGVDAERLHLLGVCVGDEEHTVAHENLFGAAALDYLLRVRVVVEVNELSGRDELRDVAPLVNVAEDEEVVRRVEDV